MARGERENDEQIQVSGPFGFLLKARGREIYQTIIIMLCMAGVGYLIYLHNSDSKASDALLAVNQVAIHDVITELIFVTSLTPEQRANLRMDMPESLRKKIHENRKREREMNGDR